MVIFWLILARAPLIASCAFATAASVSLIAPETESLICSANSMESGLAAVTTASSVSSAAVTISIASGSASSNAFASCCSFFVISSSAFTRCFSSSASCFFFAKSSLACFISCATLACTDRTRGIRLLRDVTLFGDDFLASMMSAARNLCVSNIELCWACNNSSTTFRLSSLTSPSIIAWTLSSACVASISAITTLSVARCTLSSTSACDAIDASANSSLATSGASSFATMREASAFLSSTARSGCTLPSQGTRQPL
mmetsp:Transcript_69298/g.223970  ORF Transcript_69298/g.223970 Transcript_69298/m.223970 type:complete len:257 (-) Transcript_69298:441-1211(-)